MNINKKQVEYILNINHNSYAHPAKAGLSLTGFTLIELIVVIIIVGILAAVSIPIYTRTIEEARGKACQNNMRIVLSAWRIYNLKYDDWNPGGSFNTVSNINTKLGTVIDERYFGDTATDQPGFFFALNPTSNFQYIRALRLSGSYKIESISCRYYYNNGTYNWYPPGMASTTWPLPLSE